MFKTVVLALGFAVASAYERNLQGTLAAAATNFTTTCNRGTTETCGANAGYCCAAVTRNGTAVSTNATLGTCVPAEFHTQTFSVSGTNWTFNCAVPATATNLQNTFIGCNATPACPNTTFHCCAPRAWTVGGAAGSRAAQTACIARTNSGIQYWGNYNISAQSLVGVVGQVTATCPAEGGNGGSGSDAGSFGAYIKVSAMMVLALVAGMFF